MSLQKTAYDLNMKKKNKIIEDKTKIIEEMETEMRNLKKSQQKSNEDQEKEREELIASIEQIKMKNKQELKKQEQEVINIENAMKRTLETMSYIIKELSNYAGSEINPNYSIVDQLRNALSGTSPFASQVNEIGSDLDNILETFRILDKKSSSLEKEFKSKKEQLKQNKRKYNLKIDISSNISIPSNEEKKNEPPSDLISKVEDILSSGRINVTPVSSPNISKSKSPISPKPQRTSEDIENEYKDLFQDFIDFEDILKKPSTNKDVEEEEEEEFESNLNFEQIAEDFEFQPSNIESEKKIPEEEDVEIEELSVDEEEKEKKNTSWTFSTRY
jgi:hypothetical protein